MWHEYIHKTKEELKEMDKVHEKRRQEKDRRKAEQKANVARKKADKKRKDAQEELDRQRMMLPNKKRKLFDKMTYGNKQREAEAEKLRKKKRKLEKAEGKRATA